MMWLGCRLKGFPPTSCSHVTVLLGAGSNKQLILFRLCLAAGCMAKSGDLASAAMQDRSGPHTCLQKRDVTACTVLICMEDLLLCKATAGILPPTISQHALHGSMLLCRAIASLAQGLFMSMLLHRSVRRCLGVADCRLICSILTGVTWPRLLCRARASSGRTSSASTSA